MVGLRIRHQSWWNADRQAALRLEQPVDQPPRWHRDVVVRQGDVLGNIPDEDAPLAAPIGSNRSARAR